MHLVVWRCPRIEDFSLQNWSEGGVVFDDAEGHLHELTLAACDVFNLLLNQNSWTSLELANTLLGEEPSLTEVAQMDQLLMHFEAMNFVERVVV